MHLSQTSFPGYPQLTAISSFCTGLKDTDATWTPVSLTHMHWVYQQVQRTLLEPKPLIFHSPPPSSENFLKMAQFLFQMLQSQFSTCCFSSVQFSRSVVSNSLQPQELQHARPPCPSPSLGVHSDSRPSSP